MRDLEQLKYSNQEKLNALHSSLEILEYIKSNKAKIRCKSCGYEWYGNQKNYVYGRKTCPVCTNQKVVPGINSLWDTHPHIAKYLKNKQDGYNVTYGSGKKLEWICPSCGYQTKPLQVCQITKHGISCHRCSDNMSFPNKYMFRLLEKCLNGNFDYEVEHDWCKFQIDGQWHKGRYDFEFVFQNNKYIVEMDGGLGHGHDFVYDKVKNGKHYRTPEICSEIDTCKDKIAYLHGYKIIRIDCLYSDFDYITQNIKRSELSKIFDLDSIDYTDLFMNCMKSRVFEAIDLWENGIKNTLKIADIMRVSHPTVVSYLKKGATIGVCSYTPKTAIKISIEDHSRVCREKLGVKVICLTTGEVFDSQAAAKKKYNINSFAFKHKNNTARNGRHPITNEVLVWQRYNDYIEK